MTFSAQPSLDKRHTVFGRVIQGFEEVCVEIAKVPQTKVKDKPDLPVKIVDAGCFTVAERI